MSSENTRYVSFDGSKWVPQTQPDLSAAFVGFWGAVRNARKDRKNPHHGNEYATLESVLGAIKDAATKYGLAFPQFLGQTENGTISVTTSVVHTSGQQWQFISSFPLSDAGTDKKSGKARPLGPQQGASASTYLKRYALLAVCGMVGSDEEDDDGEAANEDTEEEGAEDAPEPMTPAEIANLKRAIQKFAALPDEKVTDTIDRMKATLQDEVTRSQDQEVVNAYVAQRDAIKAAAKKAKK